MEPGATTPSCPPEQGPFGLELKPLDLLAHRRLRQVEPLGGAVETAAIGDGHEGTQQFEIQHGRLIRFNDQSYYKIPLL
jgi:hypothetical protein